MKIYLSGKITGDADYRKKFGKAAEKLQNFGHSVFNPAVLPDGFEYEDYMKIDMTALSTCDAIFLMNDWKTSPGAVREKKEADKLGLKVLTEENFLVRETLLRLCKDTEKLQNYADDENDPDSGIYYQTMDRTIDAVRCGIRTFDENLGEEKSFTAFYEVMPEDLKGFFSKEFVREGDYQIEYDLEEECESHSERVYFRKMIETAKRLNALLEGYEAERVMESA